MSKKLMNFDRPNIVIIFVILFSIAGFFWGLITAYGIWAVGGGDPQMISMDNASIVSTFGITLGSTLSHFASAAVLFSGKRPKTIIIILVTINIFANTILILASPALLPFFVPVIIFNCIFLILLQKNKDLEKYSTQIYRSPKSQPVTKPQNISCSNCNTIADSSNKFCKKCGTRILGETK